MNNGGEGHRRPAPMRCGLGAGWHDRSVRLCPATDGSSARCSKQHTLSGSDVSALRPGQSHGQRTRDESIRSVFRRSRSAKASLGQWGNRATQRQNSAIIVADVRRFAHVINTDGVLSTYTFKNRLHLAGRPQMAGQHTTTENSTPGSLRNKLGAF